MMEENDYIQRLEKIIDKQDDLLTHLDAKFNQQQALNDNLSNQNSILREDIQKHKNLLRDMNKTVTQHKNVVKKLKKELEDQLKIQQDLHKEYGEVIKELTDELEEEQTKNSTSEEVKQIEKPKADNQNSNSDKVELPPKDFETNYVESATNLFGDIKEKSSAAINNQTKNKVESSEGSENNSSLNKCPQCGAEVQEGYVFCESCGYKLK